MSDVKLLVLLEKDARSQISELAVELEGHGMTVEHQMKLTGTIAGYAPEEAVEVLRTVKGIAELRPETVMKSFKDDYEPGP
jgi:hypothetical protein